MRLLFLLLTLLIQFICLSQNEFLHDYKVSDFYLKGPVRSVRWINTTDFDEDVDNYFFDVNGLLTVKHHFSTFMSWRIDSTVFEYHNNLLQREILFFNDTLEAITDYNYDSNSLLEDYKTTNYETNWQNGESVIYSIDQIIFKYNEDHKLISVEQCSKQFDHLKDSLVDNGCKKIAENQYKDLNLILSKNRTYVTEYIYNAKRLVKKKITYRRSKNYDIITLDKSGKELNKNTYDSSSVLTYTTNYIHDKKSNELIKVEKFNSDKKLSELQEFDSKGNLIHHNFYELSYYINDDRYGLRVESRSYRYVYDRYGNWIERVTYISPTPDKVGEVVSKEFRTIDYWP